MTYEDEKKGELETLLNDILEDKNTNLTPENLKKGITVLGIDGNYIGTDTSDATATNEDILEGKTAYAQEQKLTGTLRVEDVDSVLDMFPSIETEISEEIDINDAVENSFNDLSIYGNSKQESTTGAAKVDFGVFAGDYSDEQMEIKIDENGIISLKGTVSSYYSKKIGTLTKDMFVAGNNAYYARSNNSNNSIIFMQAIGSISFSSVNNSSSFEITDESQESDLYIVVNYLESGTLNVNEILYPMISLESNTLYESYTGGNLSPNPDYPQEINSVANMETLLVEDDAIQNKYIDSQLNQMFLLQDSDITKVWQKVMKVYSGKKYIISWNKNTPVDTADRHGVITNDSDSVVQDFWINPDSETYELTATADGYLSIGMDKNATTVKVSKQYGEVKFKRIGKNYNKYPYYDGNQTSGGVNYEILENHAIQVTGSPTDLSYFDFQSNRATSRLKLKKGTYTFSVTGLQEGLQISIYITDKNGNNLESYYIHKDSQEPKTITFDNDIELYSFLHPQKVGYTFNTIVSFQIEKGSVATEYEPYHEDEYSVNISNKLSRVPTSYDDYTYIENGKKYICDEIDFSKNKLIKRTNRILLDKEGWGASSTTGDDFFEIIKFIGLPNNLKGKYSTVYSNYFSSTNNNRISIIQNTIWIRFPKSSGIDNLEKAQEFMRTHDVEAIYALETPIEIDLTDEELSYLEQFPLQKGVNHIYSDDDLSPKFKLKYYRDINMMLESEIINNAESKFNIFYDSKVEEFNTNTDEKLKGYNTNATNKINEYDTNADEKLKEYNTNATNKINEYNTNANEKVTEFNTNATEKTTAYNTNATNKINEYNTNATNKISEYNSNADAILKLLPNKTTDVSEVIDVDDAAESSFNELSVFGNDKQESTEGRNLLYEIRSGYLTTVENQEAITTEEVGFGNWQIELKNKDDSTNMSLEAGKYYISLDLKINSGSTTKPMNKITVVDEDKTETINNPIPTTNYQRYCFEFILNTAKDITRVIIQKNNNEELCSFKIKNVMISTISDYNYEPYTGGNPSPNPDYPQEIESIKDSVTFKRIGKNIFSINNVVGNGNNRLILNVLLGTSIAQQPFKLKSSEQVTVSFKTSGFDSISSWQLATALNDERHNYSVAPSQLTQQKTFTLDKDCDAIGLIFYAKDIFDTDFKIYDIQIEKGTEATAYEPYKENTYILPVQQEMLKINDYEDLFIKKDDGNWYEKHVLKKYIIDGENKVFSNMVVGEVFTTFDFDARSGIIFTEQEYWVVCDNALCNMFKPSSLGKLVAKDDIKYLYTFCTWGSYARFSFENNKFASIDEANQYLSELNANNKPLILYVALKTPEEILCTPEQTAVLNQLEQFSLEKGINHIFSDDELSPKFKLKYYQDINILLDKINKNIADVSAQLIEGGSNV